jgi:predicted phosphoribosyltransferase
VLAGLLEHYADREDVVVLALPRGGVPVAYEVATALDAPLDVFLVRKLGVPGREELAMGAIADGGVVVLNEDVVAGLGIESEIIRNVAGREGRELARREQEYREGRPMEEVFGRTVILVDDGLATGSSMRAAILALRRMRPGRVVVAVPAAPASTCEELRLEVDEVVCATTPSPFFAARARERYSCFDHAGADDDGQSYGFAAAFGAGQSCEDEAVAQLVDLQRHAAEYARRDGLLAEDEQFYAERNAVVVQAAERYYRSMFDGRASSWNLRDQHMVETLEALADHLGRMRGEPAKIVVWAHNSHLGDARATEMGVRGELNVGQLVRERHPDECRLIGFTTYTGTVTAADEWGAPAERKMVRPALSHSVEELFHQVGGKGFLLWFEPAPQAARVLRSGRLERAIGVIYRPGTERQSHYFRARLADQFDAVIHIDETRAVEPLERTGRWERGEVPETYPFAV